MVLTCELSEHLNYLQMKSIDLKQFCISQDYDYIYVTEKIDLFDTPVTNTVDQSKSGVCDIYS